jgi:hypothetical protein
MATLPDRGEATPRPAQIYLTLLMGVLRRITGSMRAMHTDGAPWRANQFSAQAMSWSLSHR